MVSSIQKNQDDARSALRPLLQSQADEPLRPLLHSRAETCRLLGVSLSTFKLIIGRGELCEIRLGKRRLTPHSEVERLIAERLAEAQKNEG